MKKIILILVVFALCSSFNFANEVVKKGNIKNDSTYVVYYFMYLPRCATCNKIENETKKAVTVTFKNEISEGILKFKTVDVGKKENSHFKKDFQLYTKSVVLVEKVNGKIKKYQVLEKTWELIHTPEKYNSYIVGSVNKFIKN